MDCLDCHSRPAHRFRSPVNAVNGGLRAGTLSAELPGIKVLAVRALDGGYATTEEAMNGIAETLRGHYEENRPELLDDPDGEVQAAIEVLQAIYRSTIFPEMQASWASHPSNIGHRDSLGCFRCHNDDMESADGEAIVTDCTSCHVILAQGNDVVVAQANFEDGRAFAHPEDGDFFEEFTYCTDCHTGGIDLYE
jgi:hypothetical protein